ncbi:ABC transporter ATP-binding protein [Photobacterium sp. DNB23_23_1]
MSTGKSVIINKLRKCYDGVTALNRVSLNINPGEFCTLLGASGSGKTTLLKCLAGFESSDEGSIYIDGKDIQPISISKRNIGMVFQNYALFPHMTVYQNVAFGLEMRKMSRAEIEEYVEEVLALVELDEYKDRLPKELSGGQQQRVALARALVIKPDILLMDEPLGALDKNLRKSIQIQLKELHKKTGITIIYVTHDQEEALFLSDKIALMDQGEIVQYGSPQELYFTPENKFVANFLGECNFINHTGGTVAIRPERVSLAPFADEIEHMSVSAIVKNIIFLGFGYRVLLDYEGREISVITMEDISLFQVDQEVEVYFQSKDITEIYTSKEKVA